MKISFSWLREFVPVPWTPQQAAERLEALGFEVASITQEGAAVSGIVAARILEVKPHPNADRLSVCRVNDGREELTIVCGAKNIAPGQVVPLAKPGASLAGGQKIEKAVLRGVESSGMLCSQRELGLSDDHSGIFILEEGTKPGRPVRELLPAPDTILEVEVTPNRPDGLSHIGLARELAAVWGKAAKKMDIDAPVKRPGLPIEIRSPQDCPRYIGTVVRNVKIGPSPAWMARRLSLCGVRPINNVVDITNYVLLEMGHPLHAFDLGKLAGPKIIVRRAAEGEKIAALDGKTYALDPGILVIADAGGPVAVAGIVGGVPTSVQSDTRDLLLESAVFDRRLVRRASKALGLRTESSYRFERGSHPAVAEQASQRALHLLRILAGGAPESRRDAYPGKARPVTVTLKPERLQKVLSEPIPTAQIKQALSRLGFNCKGSVKNLIVTAPAWRLDVEGEHDLIEEVARLRGYDRLPERLPAAGGAAGWAQGETRLRLRTARQTLLANGLAEGCSSSFVSRRMIQGFDAGLLERSVPVDNPLSEEQEYLRPCLSLHLADSVRKNRNHGADSVSIFEAGRAFERGEDGSVRETDRVACVAARDPGLKSWRDGKTAVDFFEMKSWAELILSAWGLQARFGPGAAPFLHPGSSASILVDGRAVGWAGLIHPAAAKALDVPEWTGLAEIDLSLVPAGRSRTGFRELPRYPAAKRDLSILVPDSVSWEQVENAVREAAGEALEYVRPFDVFTGGSLPAGEKSLAFSLSFRNPASTLTDAEADRLIQRIVEILKQKLNARLRT